MKKEFILLVLLLSGCSNPEPIRYDKTTNEWYEVSNIDTHTYQSGYREVTLKRLVNNEFYANIRVNGQPRPGIEIGDTIMLTRGCYKINGGTLVEEFVDLESRFTLSTQTKEPTSSPPKAPCAAPAKSTPLLF